MEDAKYRALVRSLEMEARVAPIRYRMKVLAIGAIAYITLVAFLVLIAAVAHFVVTAFSTNRSIWYGSQILMLGFSSVPVLWLVLAYVLIRDEQENPRFTRLIVSALETLPLFWIVPQMIFMRLPEPEGIELTRTRAPKLFEMLDELRRRYSGPRVHRVLLDMDFNASITQIPRLGLLGFHRNYLVLGMPYLCAMPYEETLATIAHEYGHLAGGHGKVGAWVYRQRMTFDCVYAYTMNAEIDSWANRMTMRAIHWFAPYFNAHTYVLARQQELEADEIAVDFAGESANAFGLTRGVLMGRWLEEAFWPKFFAQVERTPRPVHLPLAALSKLTPASYRHWARRDWLDQALAQAADVHDTHPSLRDRVEASGMDSGQLPPAAPAGLEKLFGDAAAGLIAEADQLWWDEVKNDWGERHRRLAFARERVGVLGAKPLHELAAHELHELGMMYLELDDLVPARRVLAHLLDQPGGPFPRAEYSYGCLLLRADDDRGLSHLWNAALADPKHSGSCVEAACDYLERKRGHGAALDWYEDLRRELSA